MRAGSGAKPTGTGLRIVALSGCGTLNALSLYLTVHVWSLRFGNHLDGQVDAPEIVVFIAIVTGAVCLIALAAAALAVARGWVGRWMVWVPALALVSTILCTASVGGM